MSGLKKFIMSYETTWTLVERITGECSTVEAIQFENLKIFVG